MNRLLAIVAGASLMCTTTLVVADDAMKSGGMHGGMHSMDTNGDGMIAKDEFMKFHDKQWDEMPKNKDGMVMMKDMQMMHSDRMMQGKDAVIEGKDMQSDKAKMDAVKKTDGHQ